MVLKGFSIVLIRFSTQVVQWLFIKKTHTYIYIYIYNIAFVEFVNVATLGSPVLTSSLKTIKALGILMPSFSIFFFDRRSELGFSQRFLVPLVLHRSA